MNKQTLYSIIVPIYNVEKYLKQCINSLINQTYKNIEIILVDDGSPDTCPKVCDEYSLLDSRIKVVHKKNGGLVSARKAGANIAKGDFIFCVDGDDYVALDMVERVECVNKQYDADVICFGFFENDETKPIQLNYRKGFYDKQQIKAEIFPQLIEDERIKYFPNSLCDKCYRREIYIQEQLKVDERIKIGEDAACTKPIISKIKKMYIMDDCLYYYRTNMSSMTKNRKPFDWAVPELIYKHLLNNLNQDEYNFQDQIYRNFSHNIFNVVVSQFYNKSKNNKEIKNDIKTQLNNLLVKKAINCTKYKSYRGKLMVYALKRCSFFLMRLYSICKK